MLAVFANEYNASWSEMTGIFVTEYNGRGTKLI